jgi:hypothetical protein
MVQAYNPSYWGERSGGLRLEVSWRKNIAGPPSQLIKAGFSGVHPTFQLNTKHK